ncbi:hypothetical protein NG800_000675 [Epilithonimonas ginsengisoli]|uniref:DUF2807 domain-containing protein n=1 Tax=Epilithonimonas ginsengisoli TaxID=1245592 RepID=A0ABU4JCK4_9FLAO|nr:MULTISPECIES: hypothetical protein [Chryseobacterium group]MBV6878355.1 hypothetical protein [Epilithonimonas sp. FP105]MDW8547402.1 hypothetical protein [Epilithonimonas ginsengisoli]OAH69005.1 hypothetical protein AXA65_16355 [Chryseobacterium sp. FP211-J200]
MLVRIFSLLLFLVFAVNVNAQVNDAQNLTKDVNRVGFVKGSTGMDDMSAELNIKVPDNAVIGNTRLRLLKVNSPSTFVILAKGSVW